MAGQKNPGKRDNMKKKKRFQFLAAIGAEIMPPLYGIGEEEKEKGVGPLKTKINDRKKGPDIENPNWAKIILRQRQYIAGGDRTQKVQGGEHHLRVGGGRQDLKSRDFLGTRRKKKEECKLQQGGYPGFSREGKGEKAGLKWSCVVPVMVRQRWHRTRVSNKKIKKEGNLSGRRKIL